VPVPRLDPLQLGGHAQQPALRRERGGCLAARLAPLRTRGVVGSERQSILQHARAQLEIRGFRAQALLLRLQLRERALLLGQFPVRREPAPLRPREPRQHPGMLVCGQRGIRQDLRALRVTCAERTLRAFLELERVSVSLRRPGLRFAGRGRRAHFRDLVQQRGPRRGRAGAAAQHEGGQDNPRRRRGNDRARQRRGNDSACH